MTDNEIIKALECCVDDSKGIPQCAVCQYHINDYQGYCADDLMEQSLSLINRQKAEIERLQAEYTRACAERDARICTADFFKAEAIKEFAEMLKPMVELSEDREYRSGYDFSADAVFEDIDKLVKEMVGDHND